MKKICIISSSPRRKGNSQMLCEQFYKGAKDKGHEVELINLNQYEINPCLACDYCRTHHHECVRKDDAHSIINKMIEADVWVLSTPVYFNSVSAQMKLLIDRFFAREYEIRESTKRKEVYFIVTSGAPNITQTGGTIDSLQGFINILRTVDTKGMIDGCGAFHLNDALLHPSFQQAYEVGIKV